MRWAPIPVLMAASMFSYAAAKYEPFLVAVAIGAALGFIYQAVRSREYTRAAGLVVVVVAFSPLYLALKIFLTMGLVCITTLALFVSTFRRRPLAI